MGLIWNTKDDNFCVKIEDTERRRITKRSALSDISQLFDPLGFIAPVTVTAKMFLQQLWKLELDWDAALPQELHTKWEFFKSDFYQLRKLRVPRHLFGDGTPEQAQIHIFSDASERAFGAVAYMRTIGPLGIVCVRFICAKSRVAPLKQITLPRLELCAAVVATELREKLQESFANKVTEWYMWTDSMITLGWINSHASNYHTFVANRISTIQQQTNPNEWRHVGTRDNPADLVSGGLKPYELVDNNFWFYGPRFLHGPVTSWPLQPPRDKDCLIEKTEKLKTVLTSLDNRSIWTEINHKNSFRRLQRIVAYMLRIRNKRKSATQSKNPLTPAEMDRALEVIVKHIQSEAFAEEFKVLKKYQKYHRNASRALTHWCTIIIGNTKTTLLANQGKGFSASLNQFMCSMHKNEA